MGVLRLILALSVVAGHVPKFWHPFFLMSGTAAVICFFVISGFYMALVLNEKYTDTGAFLEARARRLYPAYYFFLAIIVAVAIRGGGSFDPFALLASTTLLGLDYYVIYAQQPVPIGPAWSIAVELQFYLLAAFAFKSRLGIVAVFVVGLVLHILLPILGIVSNDLNSRLAVYNLVFFGAGGISYLAYDRIRRWSAVSLVSLAGIAALALLAVLYASGAMRWPEGLGPHWVPYVAYLCIAVLVPPLFALTKTYSFDRAVGELSYPVYLCHMFVFAVAERHQQGPWFVFAVTMAMAMASYLLVERRFRLSTPHGAAAARGVYGRGAGRYLGDGGNEVEALAQAGVKVDRIGDK